MSKAGYKIFQKSVSGIGLAILLGIIIIGRSQKEKADFESASGKIIYLEKYNDYAQTNDTVKFRYLQIDNYPKIFEIFIGRDAGDFKPKFERIDDLKLNDIITIYFDEKFNKGGNINRLAYFIDRGQETIYIKGSWEKYLGYFIVAISLLTLILIFLLKSKGKIE